MDDPGQISSPLQACRITTEDVTCLQNICYWRSGTKSKETSMTLATLVGFAGLPAKKRARRKHNEKHKSVKHFLLVSRAHFWLCD